MRNNLTFSQRNDYESLPDAMRLEEISPDLRREIYNSLNKRFNTCIESRSKCSCVIRTLGKYYKQPDDEINFEQCFVSIKKIVLNASFNRVLDFIEMLLNSYNANFCLAGQADTEKVIKTLFEEHGAAYKLDTSIFPCQFIPCASAEQGEVVGEALTTIRENGFDLATEHLRKAAEHIRLKQYGDAIADSIHAVEAADKEILGEGTYTFRDGIKRLEEKGLIAHPALMEAFKNLYGYASDGSGLRHALKTANEEADLNTAVFMYGTCACFVAYLVNQSRRLREQD